jgi:peptidoglycan/xylan/chitin deacetylase (PgdA/CDA1 family)
MKEAALKLMRLTGAFATLRMLNRGRALILTYHRFSRLGDELSTGAAAFDEQLAYLAANYRVAPLSQLAERLRGAGEMPRGLAAITIDDGYRDAYEIAYPILRRYNLPATVFVVTEFVAGRSWLWTDKMRYLTSRTASAELSAMINGKQWKFKLSDRQSRLRAAEQVNAVLKQLDNGTKDEAINLIAGSLGVTIPLAPPDEFASINWDEAREMDAHGVEIGSHTLTHPILTRISDERLRREMRESRLKIEEALRRPVEQFCYPNGDNDERVRRAVRQAGYSSAVTCGSGLNKMGDDPLSLRRIHTEDNLTRFIHSTSGFEEVKNTMRAYLRTSPHTIGGAGYKT